MTVPMTILADTIISPLVLAYGLAVLGPLILLVAVIESWVLHLRLKIAVRTLFWPVVAANVASTFGGWFAMVGMALLPEVPHLYDSIPAHVRAYPWMALEFIGVYFVVSVVIEGLWLRRRKVQAKIGRTGWRIWGAVVLANAASYVVNGPLFYYATRPTFGVQEMTFDTHWSANGDVPLYYIDPNDSTLRQVQMDGSRDHVLVPQPMKAFLLNADASLVVYVDLLDDLRAYWPSEPRDVLLCKGGDPNEIAAVSIAADGRVAVVEPMSWSIASQQQARVRIVDPNAPDVVLASCVLPMKLRTSAICWSRDGARVYVVSVSGRTGEERQTFAFDPHAPDVRPVDPPALDELVENYRCTPAPTHWRTYWYFKHRGGFDAGTFRIEYYPFPGGRFAIKRDDGEVLHVEGVRPSLGLAPPGVYPLAVLPYGDELVVYWGFSKCLYLLDVDGRRLGVFVNSDAFALPTDDFRPNVGEQAAVTTRGGEHPAQE